MVGPRFRVLLAEMSAGIAVGSGGQDEGVALRTRGSVGPEGRSLQFSLPLPGLPGVPGPFQGERCEVDQTRLSEPQLSLPP